MNQNTNTTQVNTILDTAFEGHQVRVFGTSEDPLFVVKEVCEVLEIKNSRDALSVLDSRDKGVAKADTPGGVQEFNVVTEFGLYELIFKSRTPAARKFRRWVCEVLREIRLKGYYLQPGLSDADRRLRAAQLEVRALEHELAAKRTRIEKQAVLANELPGAVPVGALVHDLHPEWSQQRRAALCGRIVRLAEQAGVPVGHTRSGKGRVRTMHEADFKSPNAGSMEDNS